MLKYQYRAPCGATESPNIPTGISAVEVTGNPVKGTLKFKNILQKFIKY